MALFLRVHPHGQQYRLPDADDVADVTKSVAEVLGQRGCVVLGYDVPDQPRADAVVIINGNVVQAVELIETPDEAPAD
jgi:hypothetical protein